jgi:hypothetical protein
MPKLSTDAKIKFLQAHVKKWHERWYTKHPDNIVGFRIDKKKTAGVESRNYSIIFQVRRKKGLNRLAEEKLIPPYFRIKFPDGVVRQIKTDVEESGVLKLQAGITSEVKSRYSRKFGTAGLFVTDSDNRVYMLTNYHVVAEEMMRDEIYYYRRPASQNLNDVKITSPTNQVMGRFQEGVLDHDVDAAFVEISLEPNAGMNTLPDQNQVKGRISIKPYPPSFKGKPVLVYSYYNRMGADAVISNNSVVLHTSNPNIYFVDLLEIRPQVTRGGDSGGAVLTPSFAILGIVVGGVDDDQGGKTYVIPFYKIDDFKNIFII